LIGKGGFQGGSTAAHRYTLLGGERRTGSKKLKEKRYGLISKRAVHRGRNKNPGKFGPEGEKRDRAGPRKMRKKTRVSQAIYQREKERGGTLKEDQNNHAMEKSEERSEEGPS